MEEVATGVSVNFIHDSAFQFQTRRAVTAAPTEEDGTGVISTSHGLVTWQ